MNRLISTGFAVVVALGTGALRSQDFAPLPPGPGTPRPVMGLAPEPSAPSLDGVINGVPGGVPGGIPGGIGGIIRGEISDVIPPLPPSFALASQLEFGPMALALQTPRPPRSDESDRLYERGQRSLERSHWDEALSDFSEVAARGGSRADGALYWKAYALNKLGRREEALSSLAELRKS